MTEPDLGLYRFEEVAGCPSCQAAGFSEVFTRTIRGLPLHFVKCVSCRIIYQNPRFDAASLDAYFSSDTFVHDDKSSDFDLDELMGYPDYSAWDGDYRTTASLRLKRIKSCLPQRGRLLEIGSATGAFLSEARQEGFTVQGLDISRLFAGIARRLNDVNVWVGSVEEYQIPSESFELICSWGGIACWRDPQKGLANIWQGLKPGGIFALNHPNVESLPAWLMGKRWFEWNHASLFIYSNESMERLLRQNGFRILVSQNERQVASLARIAMYLKLKKTLALLNKLGLGKWSFPLIVPGTTFRICQRIDSKSSS